MQLGQFRALHEPPRERVLARPGADEQHAHAASLLAGFATGAARQTSAMQEPGIDKHEWETQWQGLEPLIADSPSESLPEVDELIASMMELRGFPLGERPGEETAEPETVREFVEARRITRLVEAGETVDPGDVGLAVQAYRNLYAYLSDLGPTAGTPA